LAGVAPGSPAAAAGFQEGDVIVQVSDKKIHNIEDLTDMLRARKAGDRVDIVVRRKDQSITLSTTLRSRS
jgi:S1-C subfamily serine protease